MNCLTMIYWRQLQLTVFAPYATFSGIYEPSHSFSIVMCRIGLQTPKIIFSCFFLLLIPISVQIFIFILLFYNMFSSTQFLKYDLPNENSTSSKNTFSKKEGRRFNKLESICFLISWQKWNTSNKVAVCMRNLKQYVHTTGTKYQKLYAADESSSNLLFSIFNIYLPSNAKDGSSL